MTSKYPFEQRLLHELQSLAAATPASTVTTFKSTGLHVRGGLAIGGAVAGISTIVAVGMLTGGATSAYAVDKQADGSVLVNIETMKDAKGLEAALATVGIHADITYLPPGKACKQPRFADGTWINAVGKDDHKGGQTFTVASSQIAKGDTLVVEGSRNGSLVEIGETLAFGPVAPCEMVDVAIPAPPSTSGQMPSGTKPSG